jgi:hypothetical protein
MIERGELRKLLEEGRRVLPKYHGFTSAAGLWNRGGNFCKALVPYNLMECLESEAKLRLTKAAMIVKAQTAQEVLFWEKRSVPAGPGTREEREWEVANGIVQEQKAIIREILTLACRKPQAINAIDLNFAFKATNSGIADVYLPQTIWTGEHTHKEVYDYHEELEQSFRKKPFPISSKNRDYLMGALQDYWAAARAAKDRHILGYQRDFYGLDPNSARFLPNTLRAGEGAGRWLRALTDSGRMLQLGASKTLHQFQNIEVISDLRLVAGAHVLAQRDLHKELKGDYDEQSQISVVLAPKAFIGGNPYMVERKRGERMRREIHEQTSLTEEQQRIPVEYFNANLVCVEGVVEKSEPGWEPKEQGSVIRSKVNVCDPSHDYDAAMIGGRMPQEYENFKGIDDFLEKGVPYLAAIAPVLERDCELLRRQPGSSISEEIDWH